VSAVESILWDDWHVVAELARLRRDGRIATTLLGQALILQLDSSEGGIEVLRKRSTADGYESVGASAERYGFLWVCLGTPRRPIVEFAECAEPERLTASAGSVRVAVSGLRAVENFLDLSHLAFVHEGYLGEQPHTEIQAYAVEPLADGGIIATGCRVYQPKASPVAAAGFDVDYIYAVLRPYVVVLYKANPVEPQRKDMIALLVQPVTEETCIAHMLTCYLPHDAEPGAIRRFQQFIFGQDRPILENQLPKRLPLSPRAEISVRADKSSAAYRRYLATAGVRYGAIAET